MIFFTLAKLNQPTKYMLKVATEMQSNLKTNHQKDVKVALVFIFISSKTFLDIFCCNRKYPNLVLTSYFSGNFENEKALELR